jgi:hypothetical protein
VDCEGADPAFGDGPATARGVLVTLDPDGNADLRRWSQDVTLKHV